MNVLVNVPENIDFYSGYVHVHVYEHVHVEFCLASLENLGVHATIPSHASVAHLSFTKRRAYRSNDATEDSSSSSENPSSVVRRHGALTTGS